MVSPFIRPHISSVKLTIQNVNLQTPRNRILVEKLSRLSWKPKFYYCLRNTPTLVPVLNHLNPVYIIRPYFSKIHFNIMLSSTLMPVRSDITGSYHGKVKWRKMKFSLRLIKQPRNYFVTRGLIQGW